MTLQSSPQSLYLLALITLSSLNLLHLKAEASSKLYVVYLGEKQHEDPNVVAADHHDMLTAQLGSKEEALSSILYNYKHGFSGFAAMLTESQAKTIGELPEVMSIRPSRTYKIQTTRSWDYLGLHYNEPKGLLHDSHQGEDIIIGMVDTGIWPESPSFSDADLGPIPSRWKGICQTGQAFNSSNCNRKIIGARWYTMGVDPEQLKEEYLSARAFNNHGTHTASTAAGVLVRNVSAHGLAAGAARGGAPRARLAIYKTCWGSNGDCSEAAVLKAIDDAIHDGVDVLSLSIGPVGGKGYLEGSLNAVAKGITLVFAGGNGGPATRNLINELPWVITVAASTIDRSFPTVITLGNGQKLVGQAIYYQPTNISFKPLYFGGSCSVDSLNNTDVVGSIVLCSPAEIISFSPRYDPYIAANNVIKANGAGIIYAMYTTNLLFFFESCNNYLVICAIVDFGIAREIQKYGNITSLEGTKPMIKVSLTRDVAGQRVPSPNIAFFSSRGPSALFPELLLPDIAAPGVSIVAAMRDSYDFLSGTSVACPHISGIVALLKSLHPSWSPAAIKSALVTTASITNEHGWPIEAEGLPRKLADPFDFGGGHVNPNKAADPGLIYDIDPKDYLKYFNCSIGIPDACDSTKPLYYLNLPSISIPNLKSTVTVWRTVTNVGSTNAVYKAIPESPVGVEMVVEPPVLVFNCTHKVQTFKVEFTAVFKMQGDYKFGSLTWYDKDDHRVRIPIAIRIVIQDFFSDAS
ncbi:subtilisin-like protease SBT3.5 [Dioscorea cayenensis subsp. rotundata]|uniref:Subtilisin-like protease SBT3.5 n=1 Tax=Dioscorea cayennensis subsp. rotundata TaxID=55577 RepID=A0AB40B4T0_DIOCR|nr:subtilisin-like protease SBT3.5 [Dioscorea cayenensis subsp. rotundata]